MSTPPRRSGGRIRVAPFAIGTGVLAAVLLSTSISGSLAAFTSSIANSTNTAGSGTLIMQEQNATASVTCLSTDGGSLSTNSATCATINKFGGSTTLVPGQTTTTTVTITNAGTAPAATFTLTPGTTCTQSTNGPANGTATDLCAQLNLVVTDTTTSQVVYTGNLSTLAGAAAIPITSPPAAGATHSFTFALTLNSTAGNSYQGLQASLPLTWTFAS